MNHKENNILKFLEFFSMSIKLVLMLVCVLLFSAPVNADELNDRQAIQSPLLAQDSSLLAQNNKEWVVVLSDPRPARLQGWSGEGYSSSDYNGALELKRIGLKFAKKNGLKLKQEWFIESLSVYCLIVEFTENTDLLKILSKHLKR